jgi:hypothetical protein
MNAHRNGEQRRERLWVRGHGRAVPENLAVPPALAIRENCRMKRLLSSIQDRARHSARCGLWLYECCAMSRDESQKQPRQGDDDQNSRLRRIVAEVPEEIHRQVRMRCFQRGILVRDYIIELLAKDGIV